MSTTAALCDLGSILLGQRLLDLGTSNGGCSLFCQQSLFLLMQVLQLPLVFPLQLIYYLLMGHFHGSKAPLTGGLRVRNTWSSYEFMGHLETDQKLPLSEGTLGHTTQALFIQDNVQATAC